jgi:hypothetical protein
MPTYRRVQDIDHEIGPGGALSLAVTSADVRLTATAGASAHVRATFEIGATSDQEADEADRPQGHVRHPTTRRRSRHPSLALAQQQLQAQEEQPRRQDPLEAKLRLFLHWALPGFLRRKLCDVLLVEDVKPQGRGRVAGITPFRRQRNLLKERLVQTRLDGPPFPILQERLPPLGIRDRNQLALRTAHAHREDLHPRRGHLPGGGHGVSRMMLSVRDHDEDPQFGSRDRKRRQAVADGLGQIRAPAGDGVGRELLQGQEERAVVRRQRALEEARAGEREDPDPLPFELHQQVPDRQLGPREAVRLHVLRQHAL